MLKLITRTNIDEAWWNDIVDRCTNGNIYIYTWYLDVVCNRNWSAIIDVEREMIMPLPVREKWGISYVYQPKFVQQLGVFGVNAISKEDVNSCIDFIPKHIKWVHFNLNRENDITDHTQIQEFQTNVILPLEGDIETVRGNYRMNTKRNVRKASSHSLKIDTELNYNDTIELFQKNRGNELQVFNHDDYELLSTLLKAAELNNKIMSWGTRINGVVTAGAIFLKSHGRYVFLFSGQNEEGRANQALTFLIDQFIEKHLDSNLILDFEGSSNANLARYYKGFGGKEEKYITCKVNRLPWYLSFLKK
jgi:hypothetical protein